MATAFAMAATQTPTTTIKKPGPPVPPRPQHTSVAASLLKAQRESFVNATTTTTAATTTNRVAATTKLTTTTTTTTTTTSATEQPPIAKKKPILPAQPGAAAVAAASAAAGRTVIYKSPSMKLQKNPEADAPDKTLEQRFSTDSININTTNTTSTPPVTAAPRAATQLPNGTSPSPPRLPLKMRKAPDVPTTKPRLISKAVPPLPNSDNNNSPVITPNDYNNVVIVQSNNNGISTSSSLNRHHSMNTPKTVMPRDTRSINLGRADSEKVAKIQLNQLQPSAPLPKPRKIVQMPVATLDLEETQPTKSGLNIFRRSKTTLDSRAALRSNVTTISTSSSPSGSIGGSFLTGKTFEIKNNLRNAAERLFSEISMNHSKQTSSPATVITKHERAVQHQALLEQELVTERQKRLQTASSTVTVLAHSTPIQPTRVEASNDNCTRISIKATSSVSTQSTPAKMTRTRIESLLNSPEKKTAFHEMLISELAAMRSLSCSMENLTAKDNSSLLLSDADNETPKKVLPTTKKPRPRQRCNSIEDEHEHMADIDADNIEDAIVGGDEEDDDDDLSKTLKLESNSSSSRKRTPSGCSTDSSPYGTERSARIRTSDWIEVGDNGKKVTMTSCHISLVDSGLEDEERLDDMSSSGVGDSWDSVKEAEKRCRSAKKLMSMSELPPLPKSLSGFNKMLGSDSGLISDVETVTENNNNNNKNNSSQIDNANKNNNIPISWLGNAADVQHEGNNNINNINNIHNNNNSNDVTVFDERNGGNSNEIEYGDDDEASTSTQSTSTATTTTAYPITAGTGSILDAQLAKLKKEMQGLRHMDLSLLSQLWTLNESIQDFRTMLEEDNDDDDDDESCSPHSPTPSTTYDTASSDGAEEDDHFNTTNTQGRLEGAIPKIITTQPKLRKSRSTEDEPQNNDGSALDIPLSVLGMSKRPSTLPKPLDWRPVPRMRSAPPPPPATPTTTTPIGRKGLAPPRPT